MSILASLSWACRLSRSAVSSCTLSRRFPTSAVVSGERNIWLRPCCGFNVLPWPPKKAFVNLKANQFHARTGWTRWPGNS